MEAVSAPVLGCAGLVKRFGELVAVDGVGFEIAAGETYGLLGPNGAGKTTTIAMLCGLMERDAGEVRLLGEPFSTRSIAAKGAIGYVPQELAIYPDLTATENLAFFGKLYGLAGKELSGRIAEVLEIIELAERARDRAGEFSGGMKRRLNIGIGLLHEPKLLVLDEPTAGVDPQSRNAILGSVEQLSTEGMAVLYTTHYMEEAERLCDRVGIIDQGRIVAEGTRSELVGLVGERDRVRLTATGNLESAAGAVRAIASVQKADIGDAGLDLIVANSASALPLILESASAAGATITRVDVDQPDLEAVFLRLTGRALRD